jgi:transposase
VRREEFFRKGGRKRGLVKGKRWLLLTRWLNPTPSRRQELNTLFSMNRRLMKAYLLKESLERLWFYRYEKSMLGYLQRWINQLRWQRLRPFQKLAERLPDHFWSGRPRGSSSQSLSSFQRGGLGRSKNPSIQLLRPPAL